MKLFDMQLNSEVYIKFNIQINDIEKYSLIM